MKRKLFVALSVAVFIIAVAITILGHCGSTWVVQDPTFGPQLTRSDCTTGSSSTITSKSVATTIHWTVGPPVSIVVTDSGQNKIFSQFLGEGCHRCFPVFESPQWIDLGNGVTDWRQITWKQLVTDDGVCFKDVGRGEIVHHFGRTCSPGEEECEQEFGWFFNPIEEYCQSDPPPPCNLLPPESCPQGPWDPEWCGCVIQTTPILVDVAGNGFDLTDSANGVTFNLNNIGGREKIAWTRAGSDDAWLALDRNGNGTIDDGTELFGDVTLQPDPLTGEKKNGFRALAEYDKTSNGGNANGQIDVGDSVFSSLRLWQDSNHDGLTGASELLTLQSQDLATIDLDYKDSKKTDNHGNEFSFRAKVKNSEGQHQGRWAWDVYLLRSL